MKRARRTLARISLAVTLVSLVLVAREGIHRMEAGRILRQVEVIFMQVASTGRASRSLLANNLRLLREAEQLDPREIGVPIARGSHYLLLGRTGKAIESYREALSREVRPEVYLNLGRAYLMEGRREEAVQAFERAVLLSPQLAGQLPESVRGEVG